MYQNRSLGAQTMLAKTLEPMTYIARKPPACKVQGVAVQIFGLISNIVGSNTADAPQGVEAIIETGSSPVQEMSSLTKIRAWTSA
jgi:hypothetical protein